jgi:hypothetical protein
LDGCLGWFEHSAAPDVKVYVVPDSGHLLMLQNPQVTNAGLIHAAGGKVAEGDELPKLLVPGTEDMHQSWLEQTLKARMSEQGITGTQRISSTSGMAAT